MKEEIINYDYLPEDVKTKITNHLLPLLKNRATIDKLLKQYDKVKCIKDKIFILEDIKLHMNDFINNEKQLAEMNYSDGESIKKHYEKSILLINDMLSFECPLELMGDK